MGEKIALVINIILYVYQNRNFTNQKSTKVCVEDETDLK